MNIINSSKMIAARKGGLPKKLLKNKEFAFGLGSYPEGQGGTAHHSSMSSIIGHTDNLREGLLKKIDQKARYDDHMKKHSIDRKTVMHTKTSEIRSKSVLANKALLDIDHNLDLIKMNKGRVNEASFHDIEKEKHRLQKIIQLPPIEKISQVDNSMFNTAHNSRRDEHRGSQR